MKNIIRDLIIPSLALLVLINTTGSISDLVYSDIPRIAIPHYAFLMVSNLVLYFYIYTRLFAYNSLVEIRDRHYELVDEIFETSIKRLEELVDKAKERLEKEEKEKTDDQNSS